MWMIGGGCVPTWTSAGKAAACSDASDVTPPSISVSSKYAVSPQVCQRRKKQLPAAADHERTLIEPENPHLSLRRQCELLGLNRSSSDLTPATESEANLRVMRPIDEQFLKTPFDGSR